MLYPREIKNRTTSDRNILVLRRNFSPTERAKRTQRAAEIYAGMANMIRLVKNE